MDTIVKRIVSLVKTKNMVTTAAALKRLALLLTLITACNRVTEALECYACDSAEDSECATRPGQQLEVEECAKANDECVTSITAGLTRRGCLGRLYPNGYCAEPCEHCNTSLCNRDVYPTDRLRCYQCSGAECIDVSKRPQLLLPCPIYNAEDRCYTNIIHLSNTQRGCEHTNLPSDCPHVCLKCNYNGCNAELTVSETHCLQCTHNRNSPSPACLRTQSSELPAAKCALSNETVTSCVNKVMYGHQERCFLYRNDQTEVVQRGCSSIMGFYPTGELQECYGEFCNTDCLDIACATCNASTDANCRTGRNLKAEKCANGTVGCYACEQDTQLRRGCADADFHPGDQEACQLCRSADGCNQWSVRTCYRCNSLEHGDDCGTMTQPSEMGRSNCTSATELCVSTVISRLDLIHTVRGCAGEVPECTSNDPYCVRCNGSLCNTASTLWTEKALSVTSLSLLKSNSQPMKRQRLATTLLKYLWPFV
ncbi:uncharacterized protein LOC115626772 [Scaptodrosophila lebanonensis]|uniref:Uncharacterized protein LOC115626772 n=1 Tax=Drosophila lebanonensis TaxID=7225 RepID=A0A6J2TPX6_DROLE|nr:uncharacterized protein LOC115626772 [Scaptodrosophila lebanonensis]